MNAINRFHMTRAVFALLAFAVAPVGASRGDIFQWEYIDPADPSQGKRQSATLCPGGAGAVAAPGVGLANRNLTMAYLFGADLSGAYLYYATLSDAYLGQANLANASLWSSTLTNADLSQANLTNAWLSSSTLAGADLTDAVVVGASFTGTTSRGFTKEQLYSTASYQNRDLAGIGLGGNDLTGWNFAGQNLTNAWFTAVGGCDQSGSCAYYPSTLTNADLTDATVAAASFVDATSSGFTQEQLYSTASYQNRDLAGIDLRYNNLSGWNFAGQNLTNAVFGELYIGWGIYGFGSTLTGADLTDAVVVGASFEGTTLSGFTQTQLHSTASYKSHDLSGIGLGGNDLTGWNFAGQNLTSANFLGSTLIDADLTDATVVGAWFMYTTWTGFTKEQLYSTASYKNHDLSGIILGGNNLTGWNLAGQNLTNAALSSTLTNADLTDAVVVGASFWDTTSRGFTKEQLYSTASYQNRDLARIDLRGNDLTGWDFAGQNLTNADFYASTLTDADFRGADTRGAIYLYWSPAVVANTVLPDGHIEGVDLAAGQMLVIRDHDGDPDPTYYGGGDPIPIHVDDHFTMGPGGVLQMLFDADAWDSTISFDSGIPVTLGGALELAFVDGVNLASQIGRTFDLFDWTGVAPIGEFNIVSSYLWDASRLYSAGEIIFVGVPEASSLTLLALGLSSLLLRRLR
jgi:uncharacterized protein YjbI with pentapeptide repeats